MVSLHVEATSRCTLACPRCERTTFLNKFGKKSFGINDLDIDNFINKKKKVSFSLKLFFNEKRNWHKLLTERPFLKDHFPGYEKYIWLDADTEVLDSQGIMNLIDATEEKDLAISTEINESYVFKNTKFYNIFM